MKRKIQFIFLHLFFLGSFVSVQAQVKHGDTLQFKDVYDSAYGIKIYDALNINIGGDSTRSVAKGYALQGWMEDYYPDKQVLHKGYYIDGQLKAYKNYFPNGQVEREFKMTDLNKSAMTIYFPDGKVRSNIIYASGNTLKEEDYYPSGQLEYVEENDRKAGCYIQRKFYNQNGKPTSLLELTDPKRKIYSSKEYYDNGNMKEEGQVVYNNGVRDYQKSGKWKFYDESGTLKEEKTFAKGGESE
ncbi:MAG: hypothetical protein HY840_05230 [Bacteroidetes bacterium]|nr:hypothetical protein [Bacteroidota bacterium]